MSDRPRFPPSHGLLDLAAHLLATCMVFLAHILFSRMAVLSLLPATGLASHADSFALQQVAATLPSLALLGLLALVTFGYDGFPEAMGFRRIPPRLVLLSIAGGPAVYALYLVICHMAGHPPAGGFVERLVADAGHPALLAAAMILAAPLFEEFLFRGFFQTVLQRGGLTPLMAIGVASLCWTVLHRQYGALDLSLLFLSGMLFGMARHTSGSLWPPVVLHAGVNASALLSATLPG